MAKYRRERINDEVQKTLSLIIRDVKDPRVSESMICITGVEVTPDLKYAKVYYSVFGGEKKEVAKGLKSVAGYVRRRVAESLNLRVTPEFTFCLDESVERGARIAGILNSLTYSDDTIEDENNKQKENEDRNDGGIH